MNEYQINWDNVDLNDNYKRSRNILDPLSFDILLLEIYTNIKDINTETVEKQFLKSLESKIHSAKEIFYNNLENITKQAQEERNQE